MAAVQVFHYGSDGLSRAFAKFLLRVIKIAGQSRILEFLNRVATRNFRKKISWKNAKNDQKRGEKNSFLAL